MPSCCPECGEYSYLTKPTVAERFRDSLVKLGEIVCENCDWSGSTDDLDWTDNAT